MSTANPPSHTAKLDRILADAQRDRENGVSRQGAAHVSPCVRALRP